VLKQYQARARGGGDGEPLGKFANIDINKARPDYSRYLLNELDDEIHKHLPQYKTYLGVLEDTGLWQFTREEFQASSGSAFAT
jgi:hypothetical protein